MFNFHFEHTRDHFFGRTMGLWLYRQCTEHSPAFLLLLSPSLLPSCRKFSRLPSSSSINLIPKAIESYIYQVPHRNTPKIYARLMQNSSASASSKLQHLEVLSPTLSTKWMCPTTHHNWKRWQRNDQNPPRLLKVNSPKTSSPTARLGGSILPHMLKPPLLPPRLSANGAQRLSELLQRRLALRAL